MKIIIIFLVIFSMISLSLYAKRDKPLFKKVSAHWAKIPSGTLVLSNKDSTKINGFWMSKTEITNVEYLEFVEFVKQSGDAVKLKKVMPDTLVWRSIGSLNEPYVDYYFRHPTYRNYPVVGITHEAAQLYCEWLTNIYNSKLKEFFPRLCAKLVSIKLPSVDEWIWAAKGGIHLAVYPWGGPYLSNSNGYFLCNYKRLGDVAISYNQKTKQPEIKPIVKEYIVSRGGMMALADISAPVLSYNPNNYGLYNMSGNVAEMTSNPAIDKGGSWFTYGYDVAIEAPDPFEGKIEPNAFVGFRPIFTIVTD